MKLAGNRPASDGASRSVFVSVVVLLAFGAVAANQLWVQVLSRDLIISNAAAVQRLYGHEPILAYRGRIFSSDGRLLAASPSRFYLGIDPERTALSPALAAELANASGIPAVELLDYVARASTGAEWAKTLDRAKAEAVERIKAKYKADGVWLRPAGERDYPMGEAAAGVVGFVQGGEGQAGLEKSLDPVLRGREGVLVGMTDRAGRFLPWLMRETDSRPAADGKDVVLTIDADIQQVAMQSLAVQCEKNKAAHGVAIVMDSSSGDILALASWPSFNPNDPATALAESASGGRSSPEVNPAVSLAFEPGSTFKVFTIALGIETGAIAPGETVYCAGSKQFSVKTITCAGDHAPKKHGLVTAADCVAASCNVAAATWSVEIGFPRYAKLIEDLGLLQGPGIGLRPEAKGFLNYDDYNKTIQMANIGFGQSIIVTPVGLVSAFSVFANEGQRVCPRLVKSIDGAETPAQVGKRVFSPVTANAVLRMMEGAVQEPHGTAYGLRVPGYTLAGKTGTAQKRDPETGRVASGMHVSSFAGYFPARKPAVVILVMVDKPTAGAYYGATVAGPVYQDIVRFLIRKWKVPPDRVTELSGATE